jgi:hypothetical protein
LNGRQKNSRIFRKIREYEIEKRSALRIVSPEWHKSVSAYFLALLCPVKEWLPQNDGKLPTNNRRALQWLASYALSVEFEDNQESNWNQVAVEEEDSKMDEDVNVPVSVSTDIQGLLQLGEPLGLHIHPNEPIADFLERLHSQLRIILADIERTNTSASLPRLPLGFSTKDATVDTIALILKTLHIRDLRSLQSELNDLTVIAQAHTARPQMNASQGKVGR